MAEPSAAHLCLAAAGEGTGLRVCFLFVPLVCLLAGTSTFLIPKDGTEGRLGGKERKNPLHCVVLCGENKIISFVLNIH